MGLQGKKANLNTCWYANADETSFLENYTVNVYSIHVHVHTHVHCSYSVPNFYTRIHRHTYTDASTNTHYTHTVTALGLTRVDLLVGGNTIGINNGLEPSSELVDLVVSWWLF